MSALADRIRGIVAPRPVGTDLCVGPGGHTHPPLEEAHADITAILGGEWRANTVVVDRRWEPSAFHGRERIGGLAEQLHAAADEAPLFSGGAPARPPFVFFDLETTGLSGGAGTLAFLVGCAWFEADGAFVTRQFLLARHADERPFLAAVAAELGRAGALVSFNGKSFDAPLLEGRYLFHRLGWRGREMPHIDVLHPARRFWKPRAGSPKGLRYGSGMDPFVAQAFRPASEPREGSQVAPTFWPASEAREGPHVAQAFRPAGEGCTLQALEKQLVGFRRTGDVPGFEIPARYFQFIRSGDVRPLTAVLEHNRLDLLTLAALTSRLLHLARCGPEGITDPREALALGHVYTRGGLDARGRESYRRALDRCRSPRGAFDPIRIDTLRALALACRRARQHAAAAGCWKELVEMRGCPAPILREATEALAIHHEHRVCDLALARSFALGSLAAIDKEPRASLTQAVRHRLARIERKMGESAQSGPLLD